MWQNEGSIFQEDPNKRVASITVGSVFKDESGGGFGEVLGANAARGHQEADSRIAIPPSPHEYSAEADLFDSGGTSRRSKKRMRH